MTRRRGDERGYAVIAAMVAAAGFALVAAQLTASTRGALISASAEAARARMGAAADAGLAMALDGLEAADPQSRWSLDAGPRTLDFDDVQLTIRVEDERGKIPLNTVTAAQVRAMFSLAGADPASVEPLTLAFLLRRDPTYRGEDDDAPHAGAGRAGVTAGVQAGVKPPSTAAGAGPAGFSDLRDLLLLPGMTPALYAAIAPSASVSVRDAAFEPRTSTPFALAVMGRTEADGVAAIERGRAFAGQTTALDTAAPLALAGRPLTIRVDVRDRRGDAFQRARVVELTRAPGRPYALRLLTADGAPSQAAGEPDPPAG